MKQKKRFGLSRIVALLLVIAMVVNFTIPCFAASDVILNDTKTVETGILKYDYDKIPSSMLEENYVLDALEYIGYDVQALKDHKLLYHPDYVGLHLASNQYLLQEDSILTFIKYSDSGAPGASDKKAETAKELAATKTGYVPDVDRFKYGNADWKPGIFRVLSLFLALLMLINLPISAFAARRLRIVRIAVYFSFFVPWIW